MRKNLVVDAWGKGCAAETQTDVQSGCGVGERRFANAQISQSRRSISCIAVTPQSCQARAVRFSY